jgi:hypothetical protein
MKAILQYRGPIAKVFLHIKTKVYEIACAQGIWWLVLLDIEESAATESRFLGENRLNATW